MLFSCAAALSRLPLRVHYWFADWVLFPMMYHVIRYRRRLVAKNLRMAFPDKSEAERKRIARAFYHQFCDTIVESIWGFGCTNEALRERVTFAHYDEVDRAAKQAGGCIVMMAHMGNWEWMASFQQWLSPEVLEVNVYRPLKNPSMNRLILAIRSQRGGVCVDKQRILRELVRYRSEHQTVVVGLVSDQKPRPEMTHTWVPFLHQETGFLGGGELLAKKFGYPVFAHIVRRTARGRYETLFECISMDPKNTAEGEITQAYARILEQNIIEQPELWLWTHNRWKWVRG